MTEQTLIQWIVGQVGLGGLAAFAMWMLNKLWVARTEEIKATEQARSSQVQAATERATTLALEMAVRERADKEILLNAFKANTEAIAKFGNVTQDMCRVVDELAHSVGVQSQKSRAIQRTPGKVTP